MTGSNLKTRVGMLKNMGGNIPGGNFLGGNFLGRSFPDSFKMIFVGLPGIPDSFKMIFVGLPGIFKFQSPWILTGFFLAHIKITQHKIIEVIAQIIVTTNLQHKVIERRTAPKNFLL